MRVSMLQVVAEGTSGRWAWACYKWWRMVHHGDEREHVTSSGRGYVREMSVSVLQVVADGTSWRWERVCYKWWRTVHQGDESERVTSGGGQYIREMSMSVLQVVAEGTSGRWERECYNGLQYPTPIPPGCHWFRHLQQTCFPQNSCPVSHSAPISS